MPSSIGNGENCRVGGEGLEKWLKPFYSKQQQWVGVYLGPIDDHHRQLSPNRATVDYACLLAGIMSTYLELPIK